MTSKLFSELGLSAELLKAIDKLGYEQASPIQAEAIPILLQGKDVVGQSQTGSGKTAAFAAPAIEKVNVDQRATQILILCPTRELAVQVSEEVHKLSFFKRGLHALPVYGGQSYDRQLFGLRQGAHIVIGTPGRVMDHMRRGTLKLDALKMVVLDEVDVMLNMGFRDDIELILQSTPKERQTVFFSATIPRPIQQLIEKYARDPRQVRIEQKAMTVPTVEQVYYEVDRRYKIELLTRLIDIYDLKLGIIFCNTKRMVDDLVDHLNAQGYSADRLHGDMSQAMRDRVMNKFRKSGLEFLVATDVAARGIDVDDVEVVFNYDLPYDGEDYVHRIGRTGRKGRSGRAISFASGREIFQIRNIERYTNMRIQRGKAPTAGEVEEARANVFLDKIRATLKSGDYKRQDHLVERLLEEGFSSTDIASALLHHLQNDGAPAKSARQEEYERPARPERPPFRETRQIRFGERNERGERPSRFENRRAERPQRGEEKSFQTRRGISEKPQPSRSFDRAPKPARVETPKTESKSAEPSKSAPEKTYSDAEILASVKSPEPRKPVESKPAPKPKASRATPPDKTRLWMNLGREMDVVPIDIVNAVAGETGLPGKVVGTVDVRERHLFVDVSSEHANGIIAKLNRTQIKGHKVKVKVA
ncbi:MAG TPA: DEAD/DEAH box helicase [Verrucomicrobiae bacterium]|nr:DEAD/DEAH box helicase [Verrucomicrobiae bacterium]